MNNNIIDLSGVSCQAPFSSITWFCT
jgi:hypothetical protein